MQHLAEQHSSLASEMKKFSLYGHICAMKGLLQALPSAVLTAPLREATSPHSKSPATADSFQPSSPATAATAGAARKLQPSSRATAASANGLQPNSPALAGTAPRASSSHPDSSTTAANKAPPRSSHPSDSQDEPSTRQDEAKSEAADQNDSQDSPAHTAKSETGHQVDIRDQHGMAVPGQWSLLSHGALPACCAAVHDSTDAHHKFHAVSALAHCLERLKQCLQVRHWPHFLCRAYAVSGVQTRGSLKVKSKANQNECYCRVSNNTMLTNESSAYRGGLA